MNTMFKQPKRRLYTWTSPNGKTRNQIDYILIQKRWRSAMHGVKTLPGADCGSDHELLVAGLKLKLKMLKRDMVPRRYDLVAITERYSVVVKNRFALMNLLEREPEDLWQEIKQTIKVAAEAHVPKITKRKKSPWISREAILIADKRRHLKAQAGNNTEIQGLTRDFQRQTRRGKERWIDTACAEIETSASLGKTRDLFWKVREITGNYAPRIGGIKNVEGRDINEAQAIRDRWKSYTEKLYRRDVNITTTFEETDYVIEPPIMEAEVQRALQEIKCNKAPGADDIPIELLKASGEEGVQVITTLCQKIWETGTWPDDWKKSVYIPIPKKGEPRIFADNRTIALISHSSKVLMKIIQGRMESGVSRKLLDVQAGFRRRRGTR